MIDSKKPKYSKTIKKIIEDLRAKGVIILI